MASQESESEGIYTVLVLIALLTLLVGVGYVWYRAAQLTGQTVPFLG